MATETVFLPYPIVSGNTLASLFRRFLLRPNPKILAH